MSNSKLALLLKFITKVAISIILISVGMLSMTMLNRIILGTIGLLLVDAYVHLVNKAKM